MFLSFKQSFLGLLYSLLTPSTARFRNEFTIIIHLRTCVSSPQGGPASRAGFFKTISLNLLIDPTKNSGTSLGIWLVFSVVKGAGNVNTVVRRKRTHEKKAVLSGASVTLMLSLGRGAFTRLGYVNTVNCRRPMARVSDGVLERQ